MPTSVTFLHIPNFTIFSLQQCWEMLCSAKSEIPLQEFRLRCSISGQRWASSFRAESVIFRHEERFKECSFGLALFRSREIDLSDIRKHWAKLTSTAALITVEITAISASVIELAKFICVSRIFLFFNHFTAEALSCIQLPISDILIRRL